MAFLLANLARTSSSGNTAAPATWSYRTADTIATVRVASYFDNISAQLTVGDQVDVTVVDDVGTPTTSTDFAQFRVVSISSADVVAIEDVGADVTVYESLITTKALDVNDGGKTFGLNLAGGFTTTLPVIATVPAGWKVKFRAETAPTTAYIITEDGGTDTNIVIGLLTTSTGQTTAAAFSETGVTFVNFVANQAGVGDWCEIESNGTNWMVSGQCTVPAGMTMA